MKQKITMVTILMFIMTSMGLTQNLENGLTPKSHSLYSVQAPITTFYVDDDYNSSSAGGHIWGLDAYATISDAITAASAGSIINVAAGTYNESITVNKADLTIQGAGTSSTLVTTTGSTPAFIISANGNYIKDLGITNSTQVIEGIRISGATDSLTVDNVHFTPTKLF